MLTVCVECAHVTCDLVFLHADVLKTLDTCETLGEHRQAVFGEVDTDQMFHITHSVRQRGERVTLHIQIYTTQQTSTLQQMIITTSKKKTQSNTHDKLLKYLHYQSKVWKHILTFSICLEIPVTVGIMLQIKASKINENTSILASLK